MKRLFLAALCAASACAAPKSKVEYAENMDLSRYTRIGVLPFTDQKGRGRIIAGIVAKGLPERGFQAVDMKDLEAIFTKFKPDGEMGLGITELNEIRQATHAQAILTGAVSPEGDSAAVILMETDMGDEVFKGTLYPTHKGPFKSASEVADQALTLFADLPKRQQ